MPSDKILYIMASKSQEAPTSYFHFLLNEVLLQIAQTMAPQDRLTAALAYPEIFMNSNRVNIFAVDAHEQISRLVYGRVTGYNERVRWPLIMRAVATDTYGPDDIGRVLDIYEAVCVDRGINRHFFLNSHFFPVGLDNPVIGTILFPAYNTPLHMAVYERRQDIIDYLLRRGAMPLGMPGLQRHPRTPFFYAIEIFAKAEFGDWNTIFKGEELERRTRVEDVAIQLSSTSPNTAYTPDLSAISLEIFEAVEAGMDRLALHLLERFQNSDQGGSVDPTLLLNRNRLLYKCICGSWAMPRTIRRLFELGAHCRDFHRNGRIHFPPGPNITTESIPFSHTNLALIIQYGTLANPSAILKWEIETAGAQTPHKEVFLSIATIANCVLCDKHACNVLHYATIFVELGHTYAQQLLLWYSIEGGKKSKWIRTWLLENTNALDAVTLRFAICYRDWDSMESILKHMSHKGESADERLERRGGKDPDRDIWHETPLAIALAQENYLAAAKLLTSGANPSKVPTNIRDRVRDIQHRVAAGLITDLAAFVFGNGTPTMRRLARRWREARATLEVVFKRLLRDPAPLWPPYSGPPKRVDRLAEHDNLVGILKRRMVPKSLLHSWDGDGLHPYRGQ
ncbi:hypothetical protein F5X97DRAFT_321719 [Nemania serpens]|nr:hypothetical protein F5X97DRAFT_321719 [Nemania serpens]